MISAMPDIKRATITADDEFMVLACDGIWNSLTSAEVVEFVRSRIQAGETKMSAICEEVSLQCPLYQTARNGTKQIKKLFADVHQVLGTKHTR